MAFSRSAARNRGRAAVKFLIVLNDAPYGSERTYNGHAWPVR